MYKPQETLSTTLPTTATSDHCSVFEHADNDVLTAVITSILTRDIRAVGLLTLINRRMYALVTACWPSIATELLHVDIPSSDTGIVTLEAAYKTFCHVDNLQHVSVTLTSSASPDVLANRILRVDNGIFGLYIITRHYAILFTMVDGGYVASDYYHRIVMDADGCVVYKDDLDPQSDASKALQANVEYLMDRVLPEIAGLFKYRIDQLC